MIDKPWTPVAPGWVLMTAVQPPERDSMDIVGWTAEGEPVIAPNQLHPVSGIFRYTHIYGETPYVIVTKEFWEEHYGR